MDTKSQNEIVTIKNVSSYDFPLLNLEAMNEDYRTARNTVPGKNVKRKFHRATVPTLMWDGQTYALASGEKAAYPRFLAEHFANKIADRYIIEHAGESATLTQGLGKLNNPTDREEVLNLILMRTPEVIVVPNLSAKVKKAKQVEIESADDTTTQFTIPSTEELEAMNKTQLKEVAEKAEVSFEETDSKADLIEALEIARI